MIDALRRFGPRLIAHPGTHWQVRSVLQKTLLCRTAALNGHVYKCQQCDSKVNVYNSCGDRHCPQCGGARRAEWMDRHAEVALPGVKYFHVVFTLPDKLSSLILGNRRALYNALFEAAWKSLAKEIRRSGRFHPAALMVLHT